MKSVIIGLVVGLFVGAVNQYTLWRSLNRLDPQQGRRGIMAGLAGGCAFRLLLDAATLGLVWVMAGRPHGREALWPMVAAVAGMLASAGVFTLLQIGRAPKGR